MRERYTLIAVSHSFAITLKTGENNCTGRDGEEEEKHNNDNFYANWTVIVAKTIDHVVKQAVFEECWCVKLHFRNV